MDGFMGHIKTSTWFSCTLDKIPEYKANNGQSLKKNKGKEQKIRHAFYFYNLSHVVRARVEVQERSSRKKFGEKGYGLKLTCFFGATMAIV